MKRIHLLAILLLLPVILVNAQQNAVLINGHVTDIDLNVPISYHTVYAACNDSLGFYEFQTDEEGYYGDTLFINTLLVGSVMIYTFDCNYMIHDTLVTDLSTPVVADFAICSDPLPQECWASFFYYPDSLDFLTWHFVDMSYIPDGTLPDTWFWEFGDGTGSDEQNPTHTYSGEGIYVVCLTITDTESNCENTMCMDLMIMGGPSDCENFFTFLTNDGYTFSFSGSVNSLNPVSYFWDFGDGSYGEGQNVTHIYPPDPPVFSYYNVCLTTFTIDSTGDSCMDVSCQEVWVGWMPPVGCENYFSFEQADTNTYNFYGEAYFNGMPVPADSYLWDFGDGTTGEGQSVTHTFGQADSVNYLVCLTTTWVMDSIPNDSCYAVSCQEIGGGGGCEDQYILAGQVIMGNTFADIGQVSLYLANPSGEMVVLGVQPVDSIGHFFFTQVCAGNYYLLAELLEGSAGYGNYLPTYYVDAVTWMDADMITLGEPENPYDIYLVPASEYNQGAGEINGTVNASYGLFRDGALVPGVEIILMDQEEEAVEYDYSSDLGEFDFPSLGWGTYKVHAEVPGKVTDPAWITLDEEHPLVTVTFTITQTEVYNTLSVKEPGRPLLSVGEVYPNPVADVAVLPVTLTRPAHLRINICNQLGQQVLVSYEAFDAGDHLIYLNIGNLNNGVYILSVENDTTCRVIKKIVK